jgi:CheY-like chemotaxis protein
VKQAGGHIWFESVPGEGTTFSLYYPVYADALEPPLQARVNGASNTQTVLVVDDDLASRTFACEALDHLGYRVLKATTGQEALQVCEQYLNEIDLVLSDVMLPGMTGLELSSRLNSLQSGLKILFTSSYSPYALKHHGAIEANTPLLQKPFTLGALAAGVRETLEVHR